MSNTIITLLSFTGAIIVSLLTLLWGMASYNVWEMKQLKEKITADRLRFGLDVGDFTAEIESEHATAFYQNQLLDYGHDHFKNRMADLMGRFMTVSEYAVIIAGCIYTVALLIFSFSKGLNGALLIWAMPIAFILSNMGKLVFAKTCNFLTGRMPLEPLSARNPAQRYLEKNKSEPS